jgi:hypothetical protein
MTFILCCPGAPGWGVIRKVRVFSLFVVSGAPGMMSSTRIQPSRAKNEYGQGHILEMFIGLPFSTQGSLKNNFVEMRGQCDVDVVVDLIE